MDGTYTEKVNYTKPKLDQYGNPVINFKSMKAGSKGFFRKGGKRGRPRTRPERTTPKRKYVRSKEHTKAKIAERKALAQAKRAAKAAAKAAELAENGGLSPKTRRTIEKTAARSAISMRTIERKRRGPLPDYVPGFAGLPAKRRGGKANLANIVPFSSPFSSNGPFDKTLIRARKPPKASTKKPFVDTSPFQNRIVSGKKIIN